MNNHIAQIIAAIVGTVVGGLIVAWMLKPSDFIPVTVEASYIEVEFNSPFFLDGEFDDLAPRLEKAFSIEGLKDFFSSIQGYHHATLYNIRIQNNGSTKIKNIEINIEDGIAYSTIALTTNDNDKRKLTLNGAQHIKYPSLNPDNSISILALSDSNYTFANMLNKIQVLVDGTIVPVELKTPQIRYGLGFANFLSKQSTFTEAIVVILMAIGLVIIAALFFVGIPSILLPSYRAWISQKSELAKSVEFLRYLRINHPEKFPTEEIQTLINDIQADISS